MPQIEFDQAKPYDNSAIDEFYDANLSTIVKSGSSPTPSSKTFSSTDSVCTGINRKRRESESTVASDFEQEEVELDSIPTKKQFLRYHHNESCPSNGNNLIQSTDGNVIVVKNVDNESAQANNRIDTVAIQNSSDIQFGNKTFYNGPVTIKQFLLDDKSNKWISQTNRDFAQIENGIPNKGFNGSESTDNTTIQSQVDNKPESCNNDMFKIKNLTLSRKNLFLILLTSLCAFIVIILLGFYLMYGQQLTKQTALGEDLLLGKVLRIISRDEWLAQPPSDVLTDLVVPVKRVIITHSATEPCFTQAACTLRVRLTQTFHMESKNWDDIGYNFMVGGDGAIYEGRGWDKQGAHTKGYNVGSIGIAYIGTFNKALPNDKQIMAGFLIMQEGVKLKKLVPDYKIYAHRQLIPTESPGSAFFEIIKKWDHWTKETPEI